MRTYLIGDIHGCFKELEALEAEAIDHAAAALVPPRAVRFVAVGDLVDRGPASAAVLERYLRGARAKTHRAVYGNHEAMMVSVFWNQRPDLMGQAGLGSEPTGAPAAWDLKKEFMEKRAHFASMGLRTLGDFVDHETKNWLSQGGRETLLSLGCQPDRPESWSAALPLLRYVAGLPVLWSGKQAVVTHALVTRTELAAIAAWQRRRRDKGNRAALASTELKAARSAMWSRVVPPRRPSPKRLHVSGHTPLAEVDRPIPGVVRIDTGCVYGGKLTAYCVETGECLSVPSQTHWKANA